MHISGIYTLRLIGASYVFSDTPYTVDEMNVVYPEIHSDRVPITTINGEFSLFAILLTTVYSNGQPYLNDDNRIGAGSGKIYSISVIHHYGLVHNNVAFGQTHQVSPSNFRVRDAPFNPFSTPSTSGTSSLTSDVPLHNSQETILTTLVPLPAVQQEELQQEQLVNIHFSTNKPSAWEKLSLGRYYT